LPRVDSLPSVCLDEAYFVVIAGSIASTPVLVSSPPLSIVEDAGAPASYPQPSTLPCYSALGNHYL